MFGPLAWFVQKFKTQKVRTEMVLPKVPPKTTTSIAIGNQTWMAEERLHIEIDEIVNGKNIELNAVFF